MTHLIIGLSGERQQGKTEIARHLVEKHGFSRIHPFSGGKAASRAYFVHLGATEQIAQQMTDGNLKDYPAQILPVDPETGEHFTPRFWMEKFGQFMGAQLGPDWTIGREIERHCQHSRSVRLVCESIVYEADVLREMGGIVVRVERPGDRPRIAGIETDAYSRLIRPDHVFINDAASLDALRDKIDRFIEPLMPAEMTQEFVPDGP